MIFDSDLIDYTLQSEIIEVVTKKIIKNIFRSWKLQIFIHIFIYFFVFCVAAKMSIAARGAGGHLEASADEVGLPGVRGSLPKETQARSLPSERHLESW